MRVKASIIVGINMQPQADMGYIVPIQDMKAGTMSFANAVETKITPYLMSYRDGYSTCLELRRERL